MVAIKVKRVGNNWTVGFNTGVVRHFFGNEIDFCQWLVSIERSV